MRRRPAQVRPDARPAEAPSGALARLLRVQPPTSSTRRRSRRWPAICARCSPAVAADPGRARRRAAAAGRGGAAAARSRGAAPDAPLPAGHRRARALRASRCARTPDARRRRPATAETLTYGELDRAGQPAGAPPARAAAWAPETPVGALPGALARAGGRPPRACSRPAAPTCRSIPPTRPSGWRFVLADSGAPRGAHPRGASRRVLAGSAACTWSAGRRYGARSAARDPDAPCVRAAPCRTTPPTSSTPRARPAGPRASWSPHGNVLPPVRGHRAVVRLRRRTTSGRCSTPSPSTSRSGRSGARCSTAGGWWWCRTW